MLSFCSEKFSHSQFCEVVPFLMYFMPWNFSLQTPLKSTSSVFSFRRNMVRRVKSGSLCCHRLNSSNFFSLSTLCDHNNIFFTSNKRTGKIFPYKDFKTNGYASSFVEIDKRLVMGNSCNNSQSDSGRSTDIPQNRCEFFKLSRNFKNRTTFSNVSPVYARETPSFLCERHQHVIFMHFRFYTNKSKSSRASYYDVLGVTPNATQSQIKSAYYRLSKLHHPDTRKEGREDKLFVSITEAYEVLGNIRKRRLYDRGVYNPRQHDDIKDSDVESAGPSYNESEGFTKKRQTPPTGRSKIYNFDEFYKQHYGNVRMKKKIDKKYDMKKEEEEEEWRQQKMRSAFLTGSLICWVVFTFAYLKFQ